MRRFAFVVPLVLAFVNCPRGHSEVTAPELAPITEWSDYLSQSIAASCEWAVRCHALSEGNGSMIQCAGAALSSAFESDPWLSLQAGALSYDPAQAAVCINAIRNAGCGGSHGPNVGDACRGVIRAARHPGEKCYSYGDCIDSDCDLQGCSGVCVARAPLGGVCGGEQNIRCGSDSAGCCIGLSITGVCAGYAQIGAPCGDFDECGLCDHAVSQCLGGHCTALAAEGQPCSGIDCRPGLYCSSEKVGGVCRPITSAGGQCDSRDQSSRACGELVCSEISNRCEPRDRVLGETCGMRQHCVDSTCTYPATGVPVCGGYAKLGEECSGSGFALTCEYALNCDQTTGRCVERGDEGEACRSGSDCKMLLECDGGACRQFPARGEPCNYASDYFPKCGWPYVCDSTNHCADSLTDGADCMWSFDCASGRCVQGKCAPACRSEE